MALPHAHVDLASFREAERLAAAAGNALCFALLPLAGWMALQDRTAGIQPFWIVVLAGVMVPFAVLRNIPSHPLTLLAPTT